MCFLLFRSPPAPQIASNPARAFAVARGHAWLRLPGHCQLRTPYSFLFVSCARWPQPRGHPRPQTNSRVYVKDSTILPAMRTTSDHLPLHRQRHLARRQRAGDDCHSLVRAADDRQRGADRHHRLLHHPAGGDRRLPRRHADRPDGLPAHQHRGGYRQRRDGRADPAAAFHGRAGVLAADGAGLPGRPAGRAGKHGPRRR